MKKLFLSLVAMMIAMASFAQTSLLATLSHDGTVKTYYGASAFKAAYTDATHGDVITLSPGTFLATDIKKAITLRGAGMDSDSLSSREPTIITGDFELNIVDNTPNRLTIEGVYHNHTITYRDVNQPMFLKCRFRTVLPSSVYGGKLINASFIHCKIASGITLHSDCTASFLSCVVNSPANGQGSSVFEFTNCVIRTENLSNIYNSSIKNCFLRCNSSASSNSTLSNTCTMFNNVGISSYNLVYNKYIFQNSPNSTNKTVSSLSEVFKTWTGAWDDNEKFELVDEAKTKYIGTDGTQIAIYGGNLPFESTPSNPQITKCQVASKSTADGKLSVDITIRASE